MSANAQYKPVLVCSACWKPYAVWEIRPVHGESGLFAGWWFEGTYRILDPNGTATLPAVHLDGVARQCVGPCCLGCGVEPLVLRRTRAQFPAPSIWNLWRAPTLETAVVVREEGTERRDEVEGAVSVEERSCFTCVHAPLRGSGPWLCSMSIGPTPEVLDYQTASGGAGNGGWPVDLTVRCAHWSKR